MRQELSMAMAELDERADGVCAARLSRYIRGQAVGFASILPADIAAGLRET